MKLGTPVAAECVVDHYGRGLLEETAGENVCVPGRELQLRRDRPRHLHVELLADVAARLTEGEEQLPRRGFAADRGHLETVRVLVEAGWAYRRRPSGVSGFAT